MPVSNLTIYLGPSRANPSAYNRTLPTSQAGFLFWALIISNKTGSYSTRASESHKIRYLGKGQWYMDMVWVNTHGIRKSTLTCHKLYLLCIQQCRIRLCYNTNMACLSDLSTAKIRNEKFELTIGIITDSSNRRLDLESLQNTSSMQRWHTRSRLLSQTKIYTCLATKRISYRPTIQAWNRGELRGLP